MYTGTYATASKHDDFMQLIRIKGFDAVITYGKADDPSSARGGTAIIWDTKTVDWKKTLDEIPGYIRVQLTWGGVDIEVASVYAPASTGVARIDFFNKIETRMTPLTWVGGDGNCVPDVTVDVDSPNPLGYPNVGADALGEKMEDIGLVDERREQLQQSKEFTRKGVNVNGETVSTRLDRWYSPASTNYLLSFETRNNFVFKQKSSDHSIVIITLDNKKGVSGSERETIDEELTLDPEIQREIEQAVEKTYASNKSEVNKWTESQAAIKIS